MVQVSKKMPGMHVFTISKLSPDKSMELLREAGLEVSEEQAEEIMEFLYMLTEITLKEFFIKPKDL